MGIFDKLFGKKSDFASYTKIVRTRIINGITFPSFIKKGNEYFFSDVEIFEDGIFYCNDFVDLGLLKDRVEEQWLNYQVPQGEKFYVNNLGTLTVMDPAWVHTDNKAFVSTLKKYLKELNPLLKNVYDFFGENTQEINGVKVPLFQKNSYTVYEQEVSQISRKKVRGNSTQVFYTEGKTTYLAELSVFEDGTMKVSRVPETLTGNITGLESMFNGGGLTTNISINTRVTIYGLGEFTVTNAALISNEEKMQEINQLYQSIKV